MRLHAEQIGAGYGDVEILRSISLSVEPGEFVALVGPNGCGKSTLLKALSRILPLRSGSVTLDDQSIWSLTPRELASRMAFVPQQEPTNFDFTVRDVVLMGRYPHMDRRRGYTEEDHQRVREALSDADITELADRAITRLSGGEHRRVLLARALAQSAPVMLLDEPTAHLDVTHQAELLSLILNLVRTKKVAALAALHELNHAADYCDRLVLMKFGEIVVEGAPEEVITPIHLLSAYGARARVGVNPVSGRPIILSLTSARGEDTKRHSMRVHLICGGGSGVHTMHTLIRHGFSLTAGVLNESDNDCETAISLGVDVVTEAPFSAISDSAAIELKSMLSAADIVVVAETPIGHGNLANFECAEAAQLDGKQVVLLGMEGLEQRDYTDGKATAILNRILARGAEHVATIDEWISRQAGSITAR